MPKTLTLTRARPGVTRVRVDDWLFALGEPVRDVPAEIHKRLTGLPGVHVRATAPTKPRHYEKSAPPTPTTGGTSA